jgi:hypothetical protein
MYPMQQGPLESISDVKNSTSCMETEASISYTRGPLSNPYMLLKKTIRRRDIKPITDTHFFSYVFHQNCINNYRKLFTKFIGLNNIFTLYNVINLYTILPSPRHYSSG